MGMMNFLAAMADSQAYQQAQNNYIQQQNAMLQQQAYRQQAEEQRLTQNALSNYLQQENQYRNDLIKYQTQSEAKQGVKSFDPTTGGVADLQSRIAQAEDLGGVELKAPERPRYQPTNIYEARALQQVRQIEQNEVANVVNMYNPILQKIQNGQYVAPDIRDAVAKTFQQTPGLESYGRLIAASDFTPEGEHSGIQILSGMKPEDRENLARNFRPEDRNLIMTVPGGKLKYSVVRPGVFKVEDVEGWKDESAKGLPKGASGLRVQKEAFDLVKSGEFETVQEALPAAAENVKQRDETEKEQRRVADEERRANMQWQRMEAMQNRSDARFDRRMNLQEFRSSVAPANAAYQQASKFSVLAAGFEGKIKNNVELMKDFISDYERKHPIAKTRAGAIVNDILSGKIKGEGKYANIQNVAGSLQLELGKLESGSYGASGATKHAVDAFNKLSMAKGTGNVKEQLDGILKMASSARMAQDEAKQAAEEEVNTVRAQYGLPALMTPRSGKIQKPQPAAPKKIGKYFVTVEP